MAGKALNNRKARPLYLMPVTRKCLMDNTLADKIQIVVLHHAIRDTRFFIESALDSGMEVGAFIAKPNSLNEEELTKIEALSVPIVREPANSSPPYKYYEESECLYNLIISQVKAAKQQGRKLILIDVGGYFCKPLLALNDSILKNILGVVEVTTFGYNRYKAEVSKLKIPVISIARSPLKEAEAQFVGESTIRATEDILQDLGYSIAGKTCGIIGYGMIGSKIAASAKSKKLKTLVYDNLHLKNLRADLDGYESVNELSEVLEQSDIIFSATANQSISFEQMKFARDSILFVSGGSRANEFDVNGLISHSIERHQISNHIEEFTLPSKKRCMLANQGKAINFLKDGTPEEIMDLVFAELAESLRVLANSECCIGNINEVSAYKRDIIAKEWKVSQKKPMFNRFS